MYNKYIVNRLSHVDLCDNLFTMHYCKLYYIIKKSFLSIGRNYSKYIATSKIISQFGQKQTCLCIQAFLILLCLLYCALQMLHILQVKGEKIIELLTQYCFIGLLTLLWSGTKHTIFPKYDHILKRSYIKTIQNVICNTFLVCVQHSTSKGRRAAIRRPHGQNSGMSLDIVINGVAWFPSKLHTIL